MKTQTYTIESETGEIATAIRDETEAREAGEKLAEFDPQTNWFLVPHTLH